MEIFEHMLEEGLTPLEAARAALEEVQADCNGWDCADCPYLRTHRERWGYDGEQPADVEVCDCDASYPEDCKRLEDALRDFDYDLDFPTRLIAEADALNSKLRDEGVQAADISRIRHMLDELTYWLGTWHDYAMTMARRVEAETFKRKQGGAK